MIHRDLFHERTLPTPFPPLVSTHIASDDVVFDEDGPQLCRQPVDGSVRDVPHQSRLSRSVGAEQSVPERNMTESKRTRQKRRNGP